MPWRWLIVVASAAAPGSSRSRQAKPRAEALTPRNGAAVALTPAGLVLRSAVIPARPLPRTSQGASGARQVGADDDAKATVNN